MILLAVDPLGTARGLGRGEICREFMVIYFEIASTSVSNDPRYPSWELRATVALKMGSNCSILVELLQRVIYQPLGMVTWGSLCLGVDDAIEKSFPHKLMLFKRGLRYHMLWL